MVKKKINFRVGKKFFSLYLDPKEDAQLIRWLEQQEDASAIIKTILWMKLTGELVSRDETEKKDKNLDLKNKKLLSDIRHVDTITKIALVHELHYSPEEVIKIMNGEKSIIDEPEPTENVKIQEDLTKKALEHFTISNHRYVTGTKVCYCVLCKNPFEWSDVSYRTECLRHISAMHTSEALK